MKAIAKTKQLGPETHLPATTTGMMMMKMHYRLPLLMLLSAPFAISCLQEIDTGAAKGTPLTAPPDEGKVNGFTTDLDTPAIELDMEGDTTRSQCQATLLQATKILSDNCGGCHSGETAGAHQGAPPFDFLFDLNKLKTAESANNMDTVTKKPFRFLFPGHPDRSRLFVRISLDEMPPADLPTLTNPRPSLSDLSVLRTWIATCIGFEALPTPTAASAGNN